MIQRFSEDLSKLEIYANGVELAQVMGLDRDEHGNRVHTWPNEKRVHVVDFENPVLVTDNYKIGQLEPVLRDTVFALCGSPVKTTEYGNTRLEFDQKKYIGVWGPSIDTLLFCKAVGNSELRNTKRAIELGFGSGFISKFILNEAPDLELMTLVDFNGYAKLCAEKNINDKRARIVVGNGVDSIKEKKYDLMVCNPPYIPRPKSIDDNSYEGIGLLHYLITNASKHLNPDGRLIVNISSLCERIIRKAIDESNVSVRELDKMEVPLKVYNVLNNGEWMDYLLQKGLIKNNRDGYDYWQTIRIMEITKNGKNTC